MNKPETAVRASARRLAWGSAVAGCLLLSACSGGADGVNPAAVAGKSISGKALGGQQPVVGATVSLYAASTSGYGASSAALATTTTGPGGTWTFSGVSCPSGPTDVPLYVVATGGSAVGGSSNSAIGLSSALGPCSSAINGTGYNIDEVTTVASAYALAQFLDSTGVHLGTSSTNTTGLANAVANVALLADLDAGTAQTMLPSGASGTLPAATLNSVANILAACVNSSGASSSQCTSLISAATPSGGTAPATTLQAALNIAHNPGNNVAALYALAGSANAPFQTPTPLSVQPNDWTLAVQFTGGGLATAADLAIDGSGSVWVVNSGSSTSVNGGQGSVSDFLPIGVPASGSPFAPAGLNQPLLVAVDGNGNIWVGDNGSRGGKGSLYELGAMGSSLSGPYSADVSGPVGLAIDVSGNVWLANGGNNTVAKLSSASSYSASSFSLNGDVPAAVAIDGSGGAWVPLFYARSIVALASDGAARSGSPYSGGGLSSPEAVAVDGSGNIWIANQLSDSSVNSGMGSVTMLNSNGVAASASPFAPKGMQSPAANSLAIDGAGRVWVANSNGSVSVLNADGSAGAPVSYGNGANLGSLAGLALDSSGDVWVVNSSGSGALSKLIGVAAPVKTPLVGPAVLP